MRSRCAALAFAALLALPLEARANGRFPASNAVFFAPSEPDAVVARATFGLFLSRDRATTWGFVCEPAYHAASDDPMIVVTGRGTILAGAKAGLSLSRDGACTFDLAGGALAGFPVVDLAARGDANDDVFVFASQYLGLDDAGEFRFRTQVFETKDDARTFAPLAATIDARLVGETIDVAPSDPDRVYLSGEHDLVSGKTGLLLVSRDHGATFEPHEIPLADGESGVFIAAVDPTSADRVYVRTSTDQGSSTRLLLTDDAGGTFRTIFTAKGPLAGFALGDAEVFAGGPKDGLYAASTADLAFAKRSSIGVGCLAIARDGLWACASDKSGFAVGLSTDRGATFLPKLRFCDVRGTLACPADSAVNACSWTRQRPILGCDADAAPEDAGAPRDAGRPEPVIVGAGGSSCATASAPLPSLAALGCVVAALLGRIARRLRRPRR